MQLLLYPEGSAQDYRYLHFHHQTLSRMPFFSSKLKHCSSYGCQKTFSENYINLLKIDRKIRLLSSCRIGLCIKNQMANWRARLIREVWTLSFLLMWPHLVINSHFAQKRVSFHTFCDKSTLWQSRCFTVRQKHIHYVIVLRTLLKHLPSLQLSNSRSFQHADTLLY